MEEYVQMAIRQGLHTICFLEHLETGIVFHQRSWLRPEDFAAYFSEGERLRARYQGRIRIQLGVEAGYNPEEKERFQALLAAHPWDRVGLSRHFLRLDQGPHLNLLSRRREGLAKLAAHGPERVLTAYFASIKEALLLIECDLVCHLDAALRHYPGIALGQEHLEQVDEILEIMAMRQVALEINTSGFEIRDAPFPNQEILGRAMARRIPLTLGSDAHQPQQVGRHFERIPRYLAQILAAADHGPNGRQQSS